MTLCASIKGKSEIAIYRKDRFIVRNIIYLDTLTWECSWRKTHYSSSPTNGLHGHLAFSVPTFLRRILTACNPGCLCLIARHWRNPLFSHSRRIISGPTARGAQPSPARRYANPPVRLAANRTWRLLPLQRL